MRSKAVMLIALFVLLSSYAAAKEGHIKLLAVAEGNSENLTGQVADLFLEITEGKGRVFIDTVPLTKMDTQISTRFAKEIACSYLDEDCGRYDFFYTITAGSSIIGGPSAGAAIAMLTIAVLDDIKIDESIAITGTINSGGLIGPVGGIMEKIETAAKAGIRKVLIPKSIEVLNEMNESVDIQELSGSLGIEVHEVADIDEMLFEFTGIKVVDTSPGIVLEGSYTQTMRYLAELLCNRTAVFEEKVLQNNNASQKETAINLTASALSAAQAGNYYSAASYCFGANVEYGTLVVQQANMTGSEFSAELERLKQNIIKIRNKTDSLEKKTMTDLQAYMIVIERLEEAEAYLDQAEEAFGNNESYARTLAYASERLFSAVSWSAFFGNPGKAFILDDEAMRMSCAGKIAEAEERLSYAQLLFPASLADTRKTIDKARDEFAGKRYALCLHKASRAKAEADTVLNVIGVSAEQIENVADSRIEIVRKNIAKAAQRGSFPIVGYSYFEYAKDLKQDDVFSALLYLEYALELGNLEQYFRQDRAVTEPKKLPNPVRSGSSVPVLAFIAGTALGLIAGIIIKTPGSRKAPVGKRGDR